MTLGPACWCLLVGDVEIQGPVTGGRHGLPFGGIVIAFQKEEVLLAPVRESSGRRR